MPKKKRRNRRLAPKLPASQVVDPVELRRGLEAFDKAGPANRIVLISLAAYDEATRQGPHLQPPARPAPAPTVRAAKPPRRKVEPEDIADIRRKYKHADTQTRGWWVDQIAKGDYGVTYHRKTIEKQLKKLGIAGKPRAKPPTPTP